MSNGGESRGRESLLPNSKTIEILHIDDEAGFAEMVAAFLERERETFNVHTQVHPEAALATLRDGETAFDCIVSDYDMPDRNGLDVLTEVRSDFPDLPFILFTGKGSEEIASEAITAGVTDYLQKGSGTEQYQVLANRIHNAVERYWAERYLNRGLEAIETAQDGISILSGDGVVQYANAACADLLGYDRQELAGMHWETFYRDEDVNHVYDELLPSARESRWNGCTKLLRRDGTELKTEHTLAYTDDGSLICTLTKPVSEGTVDRERSAKEQTVDKAPVGVVLTDPHKADNPIVYANDAFSELAGYDRSAIIGRNCRFLQGERTREEPIERMREAVRNRESVTVELRNYRADGTEFWNRVRIAPIFDADGALSRFVGIQDDITEEKRRERRLQTNTARLEALFEGSPDMLAIHDADGVIEDVNDRMCEATGYSKSELIGMKVWDIDPTADPERAQSFWENLSPDSPRRFEGELKRKDGTTFPIEVHLIRLDLDGEDRFVAMDRDITEQCEREAELVQQNERLDRFSSVVSHDLRNPIQVAKGRLSLLREECDSEHAEHIGQALDRMSALIEDLLTLAHDGEAAIEFESVELGSLVRTCWETVATDAATLSVETDATVRADRDQLRQLFENLIRNAIEHGSMSPHSNAREDAIEHGGSRVAVTVGETESGFYFEDDGSGIPETERDRVFDAGYSTAADGTGFGLSIVERIVETHGWEIEVTEGRDGGARFEITGVQ